MHVETRKRGNQILEIRTSECPEDPREWSNLGIMACGHRNHQFGDVQIESQADYDEHVRRAAVMLPLFLLDHSGLHISTAPCELDPGGLDTSRIGVIYATRDGIRECFGCDLPSDEKVRDLLELEIETYNQFLRGAIYEYVLYETKTCDLGEEHRELVDSCGGFYDLDDIYADTESRDWEVVSCQE